MHRERDYAFGQLILRLRMGIGLTQAGMAEILGVSRHAVGAWESGESYPKADRLKVLIALGIQEHAFRAEHEAEQIRTLWRAAHQKQLLDEEWLREVLRETAATAGAPSLDTAVAAPPARSTPRTDWGDALDVASLYGRDAELELLARWVVHDHCRVVSVLGLGGIGKSALAVTLMRVLAPQFDVVIWRSLRDTPGCETLVDSCLQVLTPQALPTLADSLTARLQQLYQQLRERRCLLILDNFEALMQPGAPTGTYRSGYVEYGELLRALSERDHQSCLLLTSREKPAELGLHEGRATPVRTLQLTGLEDSACQRILEAKDITGTPTTVRALTHLYGGNPLALQLVSEPIHELFGGDVAAFLALGDAFFNGVGQLLAQQLGRSTPLEQSILYWLAVARELLPLSALLANLGAAVPQREVLVALKSLRRRVLIERAADRPAFTLQPVIMEFVTDQLVEAVHYELVEGQPQLLSSHALVQATATDYVRLSQEDLIARPLLERLVGASGGVDTLERQLLLLLAAWRGQPRQAQGYGPGNVVNLLRLLRGHLRGLDLAQLTIQQAYLAEVGAQDARLVDAELADTVLADAFHFPGSVVLSGDGVLLAAGTSTGQIWLWRVADRRALWTVEGHSGGVWSVALSSDGRLVASGGGDGTVRLWEAGSGRPLATLEGHSGAIRGVALSTDGRLVASGSLDGTVRLWEASSGRPLATLEGHTSMVWSVALSADGQLLASGSFDGTVKLWEAERGTCLRTLRAERRYERMNITGLSGVTEAQKASLRLLGAIDETHEDG